MTAGRGIRSVGPYGHLAEKPQRDAQRQRKADHEDEADIRVHGSIPPAVDSLSSIFGLYPGHHAMQDQITRLGCGMMPQAAGVTAPGSLRFTDRAVAAGHDIHMAMRALAMAMYPDKLFRLAAGRASGHDMRRLARPCPCLLIRRVPIPTRPVHPGPSLSFSRWRAATVPSWNVPNQASSGKSTLP